MKNIENQSKNVYDDDDIPQIDLPKDSQYIPPRNSEELEKMSE